MPADSKRATSKHDLLAELDRRLKAWAAKETAERKEFRLKPRLGEAGLWDGMPEIDSKEVVRASHVFAEVLGIELDVRLIRRGGYASIEEVIQDLGPPMVEFALARAAMAEATGEVASNE